MIDDGSDSQDQESHGTHVAGTIAAELSEGDISSQENDIEREHSNAEANDDRTLEHNRPERFDRDATDKRPNRRRH